MLTGSTFLKDANPVMQVSALHLFEIEASSVLGAISFFRQPLSRNKKKKTKPYALCRFELEANL